MTQPASSPASPAFDPDPYRIHRGGDTAEFAVARRLSERCYRGFAEGPEVMGREAVQALLDAGWTLTPPPGSTGSPLLTR